MAAKEALRDLLEQLESFVTTKTVVGEAIHINDTIILPLVDVSFGAAAGSGDKQLDKKGNDFVGGGLGAKMSPSAVIVIKDGQTRLVNVKNQDTVTKVLDMVPDVIDRFTGGSRKKEDQVIRDTVKTQTEE